jgi:hypothetical protein
MLRTVHSAKDLVKKQKKIRKNQSNFVRGYFYECRKVEISHKIWPFFYRDAIKSNILEPI